MLSFESIEFLFLVSVFVGLLAGVCGVERRGGGG